MNKLDTPINTREMVIQEVAIDSVTPYEKNPRKIPKEAVDKVAASIREFGFKKIKNDKMDKSKFFNFLYDAFSSMASILKDGCPFYIWFASREHLNFESALNNAGLNVRQELVWNKNSMTLGRQDYQWKFEPCLYGWKEGASHKWYGGRDKTNVLEFNKPLRSDMHPTMKPVPLFAYLIENSSKEGDIVVDIFGGSGTTLIACEEMNRVCRMMELDPIYCQVIINRWEALTGRKATKIC